MKGTVVAVTLMGISTGISAETLPVTADAVFSFNGQEIVISRTAMPNDATLFAITQANASCPAPCLSPMMAADNVPTLGELDVIQFLSTQVETGDGLLIDARLPKDRQTGFIPASVNIPATTVSPENPYRDEILMALGGEQFQGIFSFQDAMALVVFDGGPATQDAPTLIGDLLAAGYPAEKIAYYRGGMQVWAALGLSTFGGAQ